MQANDQSHATKAQLLFLGGFAASLLSAFEELVPEGYADCVEGMRLPERELGYNACRAELLKNLTAFKEGK